MSESDIKNMFRDIKTYRKASAEANVMTVIYSFITLLSMEYALKIKLTPVKTIAVLVICGIVAVKQVDSKYKL